MALKTRTYKNYTAGGWEYTYDLYDEKGNVEGSMVDKGWSPQGGLALKNVYHNGYSFAKDIRVVSIWVFPKDTKRFKPKQLVLGAPDFIQQPIKDHQLPFSPNVSKAIKAPLNFSSYNTETALEVKWVSTKPVFEDANGKSRHLWITQTYIFSDYNDEPRHEPSGVLMAARLFPITTVYYGDEQDGYIASVRIDYRLHLNLDGTLNYKVNEVFNKLIKNNPDRFKLKNFPNQAGAFKDFDDPIIAAAKGIITKSTNASNIFSAVEKPLLLEICGTGLLNGSNVLDTNKYGWDNIHWWGFRGEGQPIISAPGGFHAAHLHWRWGAITQLINKDKQFKTGIPEEVKNYDEKKKSIEGALVDPSNWIQDIKFAIAKNISTRTPDETNSNLKALSTENFFDLFQANNLPNPENIEKGDDLVLWYSIEAKKDTTITKTTTDEKGKTLTSLKKVNASISGKYFIQGIFFAHEAEKSNIKIANVEVGMIGTTEAQYFPQNKSVILKSKKWER